MRYLLILLMLAASPAGAMNGMEIAAMAADVHQVYAGSPQYPCRSESSEGYMFLAYDGGPAGITYVSFYQIGSVQSTWCILEYNPTCNMAIEWVTMFSMLANGTNIDDGGTTTSGAWTWRRINFDNPSLDGRWSFQIGTLSDWTVPNACAGTGKVDDQHIIYQEIVARAQQ